MNVARTLWDQHWTMEGNRRRDDTLEHLGAEIKTEDELP